MTTSADLEIRLAALEASVGAHENEKADTVASAELETLEAKLRDLPMTAQTETLWKESDKLFETLHPKSGLGHQQNAATQWPMLYRKQQVLAAKDQLRHDMKSLDQIWNTLLISSAPNASVEETVDKAPILNPDPLTLEEKQRLDGLALGAVDAQRRALALAARLDSLLQAYQTAALQLSQRTLALHDKLEEKCNP
mmetsp:Transcript_5741/g.8146  ORF Transcript_5741/g.8146 Transcript_5741/m.8146 type:complete len:196 (-) Transcript_5741:2-589(-)